MKRSFAVFLMVTVCGLWLASQAEAQRPGGRQGQRRGGQRGGGRSADVFKFLSEKYDADKDGKITAEEYDRSKENFTRFDTNKDGVLTAEDWSSQSGRSRGGRRGGGADAPVVGEKAPDFKLTEIKDETKEVKLSSFTGDKPVALIFGSCT